MEDLNRENIEAEAKRALREVLSDWDAKDLRAETSRHYGPYWQGLPPAAHAVFAGMLRGLGTDEVRIDLMPDPDRDATRACFRHGRSPRPVQPDDRGAGACRAQIS
jgi:[protein-PII] uridylyltransferase